MALFHMFNEMSRRKEPQALIASERINVLKAIIEGSYPEEATAKVGINRGQFFVRIPRAISQRLKLQSGEVIMFRVLMDEGAVPRLTLEKVEK